MAVTMEYTNQHMRREIVSHLATHVAEYEQDLIPLISGIHGDGNPLTTPQSVCSYMQDLLQTTFWADEIVLRVLSIIYKLTITVIRGDTGREERVHHNRELSEVDIVLVLTGRGHYSPAGKFLLLFYTLFTQLIFPVIIHNYFIIYNAIIYQLSNYITIIHSMYHLYTKCVFILQLYSN